VPVSGGAETASLRVLLVPPVSAVSGPAASAAAARLELVRGPGLLTAGSLVELHGPARVCGRALRLADRAIDPLCVAACAVPTAGPAPLLEACCSLAGLHGVRWRRRCTCDRVSHCRGQSGGGRRLRSLRLSIARSAEAGGAVTDALRLSAGAACVTKVGAFSKIQCAESCTVWAEVQ
jgi:hypothetical protein